MTELEKLNKLDEELRPKYPDMTQEEYEVFRNKYIRKKLCQITCRVYFHSFALPFLLWIPFVMIFDAGGMLLGFLWLVCFTVSFFKGVEAKNKLPLVSAGTLTLKCMTNGRGKRGNYTLACKKLTSKDYSSGDVDTGDDYWLWFNQYPNTEGYRYVASEHEYDDAQIGDLYYLVLKKKRSGKIKVVSAYKAELNPPDAQLSEILKQEGDTYDIT